MNVRIKLLIGAGLASVMAGCSGPDGGGAPGSDDGGGGSQDNLTALVGAGVVPAEAARMKAFVDHRVDPAAVRVSLHTALGRRIDCVDLGLQPALQSPALHGHQIASPPQLIAAPADPVMKAKLRPEPLFAPDGVTEASCPDGTVPIPEITLADVSRFKSLDDFFAKTPAGVAPSVPPTQAGPVSDGLAPPHYGPTSLHQYAHAYRYVANWGAETSMSIAPMATELNSEFSLGQIWVVGGSGAGLQTLEAGLQHYANLYGDQNPHMFIYSTRGNYAPGTGCYNNSCGDFVQISSRWYPAMGIGPVSTVGGAQYELNMHWAKAGETGDWWLSVQGEWVGYYPRSRYTAVANHAAVIDYGGEIIDGRNGGRHTMTDMGTGQFASAGWTQAAFMRRIRYNDSNPSGNGITWAEAYGLTPTQSDAACYSIALSPWEDPDWHIYFWYGGPGYANPACL